MFWIIYICQSLIFFGNTEKKSLSFFIGFFCHLPMYNASESLSEIRNYIMYSDGGGGCPEIHHHFLFVCLPFLFSKFFNLY